MTRLSISNQTKAVLGAADGKMQMHSQAAAPSIKPEPEVFWAMRDFEHYSDAIWWCLLDIVKKDISLIGRYGAAYDRRILGKLSMTEELVRQFRRYGLINSNQDAGPVFEKIYKLLETYHP